MTGPVRVALVGLIAGGYSGVPRYAAALARALDAAAGAFPDVRLTLLTTREGAAAVDARTIAVRDLALRGRFANAGPGRIASEQAAAALARADLLHFFDLTGPVLAPRRPFVTTVHDGSVMRGLRPGRHAYKRRLWPWAVRRARAIVAVSAFAKQEAIELLAAPPEKVQVIHSGPGLGPPPEADGAAPPSGEAPYFLYVGQLAASKNLPFLIEAFAASGAEADLVLVGRPGEDYPSLLEAVERSPRRDRIRLVLDASDARVDRLYRIGPRPRPSGALRRLRLHPARGDESRLPGAGQRHPGTARDLRRRSAARPARRPRRLGGQPRTPRRRRDAPRRAAGEWSRDRRPLLVGTDGT